MGQSHSTDSSSGHHELHHIMPLATYFKVAGGLFILTFLTIGFHTIREHIAPFSALVAFTIAAVKAWLVMAWFMHLKYDTPSNRLIFATGFVFLAVLVFFCVLDIYTRLAVTSVL